LTDATLRRDRVHEGRLYARAGIPIYWIINLVDGQVEVYTEAVGQDKGAHYESRQDYKKKHSVPLIVAGTTIAQIPVRDLLG
jgi:Uma2 family endonuclease